MERRSQDRRPSRIRVHFWEQGSEKRATGYTVNVSPTGMYMTANRLLPRGTRIHAELQTDGDNGRRMVEAVVARAERSLNQIRPDGMGVRFLAGPNKTPAPNKKAAPSRVYPLTFSDRRHFFKAYRGDLAMGGLFVPADSPAPLHQTVTVELRVEDAPPLRLRSRVVHCFTPQADGGLASGMATGMGVEVLNLEPALRALADLAAYLESTKPAAVDSLIH